MGILDKELKESMLELLRTKQLTTAKSILEKEVEKFFPSRDTSPNFVFIMADCILHAEFPEYFDKNGEYLMGNKRES